MAQDSQQRIHAKIVAIAQKLGNDATALQPDESIPASGLIDSAGIMELIFWFETEFGISIPQEDLTADNLGTISAMSNYVVRY